MAEEVAAQGLWPLADKQTVEPYAETELEQRMIRELARRLRYAWIMFPVLVMFFATQPDFAGNHGLVSWILAALLLAAGVWRLALARRILSASPFEVLELGPALVTSIHVHLVIWGVFICYAFPAVYGHAGMEIALVVGVAGFTSAGCSLMAPWPGLARFHAAVQLVPAFIWALCAEGRLGFLMITLIVAFFVFVQIMISVQNQELRGLHRTQLLLEVRGEELERAKEAAEEASSARGRFLANMSHEVRTPLNGVLGLTQALNETDLTAEQRSMVRSLQRSGEHLLAIVNDILDISKIGADRMKLERIPFDLWALISDVAGPVEKLASAKGLRLVFDCAPESKGWFEGDPVRIRQVLGNLLNNALKFTEAGELGLRVQSRTPGFMGFRVYDTGIGIDQEQRGDLFKEFTQADASTTRRFGGTGLGLAISKRLTDLMGGTLEVESRPGHGSAFTFEIPLPPAVSPHGMTALTLALTTADISLPPGSRILLVEDNAINRVVAEHLLEGLGARVDVAQNGKVALDGHRRQPYDLILMDCHMPEMDGFEATAAIRAMKGPGASVPIIAVSASAFPEDRERCLRAGMNEHVPKPLHREELLAAIGAVMAHAPLTTGPKPPPVVDSSHPANIPPR